MDFSPDNLDGMVFQNEAVNWIDLVYQMHLEYEEGVFLSSSAPTIRLCRDTSTSRRHLSCSGIRLLGQDGLAEGDASQPASQFQMLVLACWICFTRSTFYKQIFETDSVGFISLGICQQCRYKCSGQSIYNRTKLYKSKRTFFRCMHPPGLYLLFFFVRRACTGTCMSKSKVRSRFFKKKAWQTG